MANNISDSSYFSVSASTNKGMSGFISGLDTESLVTKMLSGAQKKIDKQEALKQQTVWKQEYYRDIITAINTMRDKYFDTSVGSLLSTNLASANFYNAMKSAITKGGAVSVLSTSSAANVGETRIAVKQLATNTALTSEKGLSKNEIIGTELTDAHLEAFKKDLDIYVGNQRVEINLNGVDNETDMLARINKAFQTSTAPGAAGITAKMQDGRLRLVSDNAATSVKVGTGSSELALRMTGLTSGAESSSYQNEGGGIAGQMVQGGVRADATAGISFTVNLDGVEKQITVDPKLDSNTGKVTAQSVADSFDAELKLAFGSNVNATLDTTNGGNGNIKIDLLGYADKGHQITVTGAAATNVGITPGATSRINYNTKLGDLSPNLQGERFSFTINGKSFTFSKDDTIGTMTNKINSSNAGVQLSYSALTDTFKFTATSTGSAYGIDIRQTEGNLLGTIFQASDGSSLFTAGGAAAGQQLTVGGIQGKALGSYTTESASFKINVNGTDYTFTLPASDGTTYNETAAVGRLNTWLKSTFGADSNGDANISYDTTGSGGLVIRDASVVKFAASTVDQENAAALTEGKKKDLALALGLSGTSNVAGANTKLSDLAQFPSGLVTLLTAGGNAVTGDTTLGQIDGLAGSGYSAAEVSFVDGRLAAKAASGSVVDLTDQELVDYFGVTKLDGSADAGKAVANAVVAGKDAEVYINGTLTTRGANTFTVDGLTLTLDAVSPESGGVFEETVINSTRDTESVVDAFKSFVEDYNAMLKKINGYVDADATWRDYAPLTAAQKKEMTDREIELWEQNSKTGLLRRDSTVDAFLSALRTALYTKPASSAFSLFDIGIETGEWQEKGLLHLDENKLRNALAADPGSVGSLFTDATDGLAKKLATAMDGAARLSSASPGTLVSLAGAKGYGTEKNNTLTGQITSIESRIKELQAKYEKDRQRYWKQFNAMEQVMAKYNNQSAFITQQFGSGY
ncbi:MAG: flagellar filament capping protein FliD [Peptococcaceae bacterium]|jgi:flagellar capping protein FliD|nr:flagellar filament capping protein FliD [Peptococcaceae bacterium]